MGRKLAYWIFLGAVGFGAFFVLRPQIDFNAGGAVQDSRTSVEIKSAELSKQLGFSVDSLNLLTTRQQHIRYFEMLEDSLDDISSFSAFHDQNLFLSGWHVLIGSDLEDREFLNFNREDLFQRTGRLLLRFDDGGRLRRLSSHPRHSNPTFVAGDSLPSIASTIADDIFGYQIANYELKAVEVVDTLSAVGKRYRDRPLDLSGNRVGSNQVFKWQKSGTDLEGPDRLILEIQPIIREQSSSFGTQVQFGGSVVSFKAMDRGEPINFEESHTFNNTSFIFLFATLALLIGLVFFKGVQHINRGEVEWKRALVIFATISLALFAWRMIFMMNTYDPFISEGSFLVTVLNFLLFGVATGIYAALAYIGWEAMARSEDRDQLRLVDAFWRRTFFFRETGMSLLRGYALAGVIMGTLALLLLLFDTFYYQFDSQFGFTEAGLEPKVLTINISSWSNAWLVALGHIGVFIGFLRTKITSRNLFYAVSIIGLGFLLAGSAALFAIHGPIWYDLAIFGLLSPVIIYAYNRSGIVTISVGWWIFTTILMVTPYMGSGSLDVAYITWVQAGILGAPLIYGFIAYRYGRSISEISEYTPEYQERMANHLRVEKEIEIARESQFKLMPLKPPSLPDVDIYGFFMPSFEVGGDYFDYVVSKNGREETDAITMTIADVSGKSMKAAMHAVFTSGLLLSRLHRDQPAFILREIAPTLYNRTDPRTFITCLIAQYHLKEKRLTIANAGHCLPVIKREGNAEFMSTPEPRYPLGVRSEVGYNSLSTELMSGDFILFYSDGLPEAVDPEGNRFGYENLTGLVESLDTGELTCNEIALEIKRRVQKFSDYQLADDTTIICLKV